MKKNSCYKKQIFFEKKAVLQDLFVSHGYKASVNLKQLVIIIKGYAMVATLDEI